jgi:hypothetical protein
MAWARRNESQSLNALGLIDLVVIYDDSEGELQSVDFRDFKFPSAD